MGDLPGGFLTFVFTDVEGSTRRSQRVGATFAETLQRQSAVVTAAVTAAGGDVVTTMGDGVFAVFTSASAAVGACIAAQRALADERWPDGVAVRVRMGAHSGEAYPDDTGQYTSLVVHQAARVCEAAHGGQIVVTGDTADAAAAGLDAGVRLLDLGEYRLRDLDEQTRLLQVVAAGLVEAHPALRAVPRDAHNVPQVFTSFIGRDSEIALVGAAVRAHRLVTLVGTGGIGKTRLGFEVTRRAATGFAGGAWVVLLANDDADDVPKSIAAAIGARDVAGLDPVATLVERLRGEPILVVLDNCEHVAAAAADVVTRLLAECPDLSILATSREPLRVAGEHIVRLDPLAVADARATDPQSIAGFDAVRLFVQRAQAADARFVLDGDNASTVAAICARLDGVPLALELAAARVRHLPVREIAARLNDRLTLLTSGVRGIELRHRTLTAAMEWSHQLLTPEERALFRRLSVFRAPFTLESVEAVCAGDLLTRADVFDLLTSLVDKSLVLLADTQTALRYRMLVTIGEFAHEQLVAEGELEAVQGAHTRHLVETLHAMPAVSVAAEPAGVHQVLAELEPDALTAFERLAAQQNGEGAAAVASRLARLHFHRGTHRQGLHLVERALHLDPNDADLRGWLLYRAALFNAAMGNRDAAQARIEQATAVTESCRDPELPSCAWHVAGDIAFMFDDLTRARDCYERASTLSDDAELHVLLMLRLAELDAGGQPSTAVAAAYGTAADHFRGTGDVFNVARCLSGQGAELLRLNDAAAASVLADAVDAACEAEAAGDAAVAAVMLATALTRAGDHAAAADLFASVTAWENRHGASVDEMLIADASDVRDEVAQARAAALATNVRRPSTDLAEAVRRLRPRETRQSVPLLP